MMMYLEHTINKSINLLSFQYNKLMNIESKMDILKLVRQRSLLLPNSPVLHELELKSNLLTIIYYWLRK